MCISAAKLGCRNGRIVPLQAMAWHAPGLSGNISGDRGQGYVTQLTSQGYEAIPHDFAPDALAFGEPRSGASHSTYLARWEGYDIEGRPVVRWTDAWSRPVTLGHLTRWERDDAGRDAFLARALVEIANHGQPLSEIQIAIAIGPVVDRIKSEANRATERSRLLIEQHARHLPVDHVPQSVVQILRRQDIQIDGITTE